MSGRIRRNHSSELKAKIALEALKEEQTIAEIGAKYDIHPKLVSDCKQEFMDRHFCIDALDEALEKYGKPEIFNTDQGSQFSGAVYN